MSLSAMWASPIGRYGPLILYAALIYVVSDQPTVPATPGGDKTAHVIAYAGLGVLWARAWPPEMNRWLRFIATWLGTGLYGVSDEWHQSFVPGRHASLDDIIADVVGGAIGGAMFLTVQWLRRGDDDSDK
ncbi:MAG: VanZ family protein [Myxococcota bacterium]